MAIWIHGDNVYEPIIAEPIIISVGCAVTRKKSQPAGPGGSTAPGTSPPGDSEQKGDLLIRDLWKNGTDSIHDMRVVNTDAVYTTLFRSAL